MAEFPKKRLVMEYGLGYASFMYTIGFYIVFPEGDAQEIGGPLSLNSLVDLNGNPLSFPLPTNRMIVFRVMKISARENKGGKETFHYLELVSAGELADLSGESGY
jgi:hypothetical protein